MGDIEDRLDALSKVFNEDVIAYIHLDIKTLEKHIIYVRLSRLSGDLSPGNEEYIG